jgi:hypothetical protein
MWRSSRFKIRRKYRSIYMPATLNCPKAFLHFVDRASCNDSWYVHDQRDAQIFFYVFISIYNSLHVSSTECSSSGMTNCINTASGNSHSMLVAEMCAVLIQFVSPDDEHFVRETCREL